MKRATPIPALLWLLSCYGALLYGQGASYSVDPTSIDFGEVTVGRSATAILSVATSLSGETVRITSDNTAFTVSPSTVTLAAEQSVDVTVRFAPSVGGSFNATLTVTNQDDVVIRRIPVRGIGEALFTLNPTAINFEPLLLGSSATQTLVITVQPQAEILDLIVVSSNPNVFEVSPTGFMNLEAGVPGRVTVTFRPDQVGLLRGAISISGGEITQTVVVTGQGAAFLLSTSSLDLGGVLTGCSGSAELSVTSGAAFDFTLVPRNPRFAASPSAFSASEVQAVTISFQTTDSGPVESSVLIFARDGGQIVQQAEFTVTAVGVAPLAEPGSVDFGEVPVGGSSPPGTILINTDPPANLSASLSASSDNPAFEITGTSSGRVDVVFSPSVEGLTTGIITVLVASTTDPSCTVPVEIPVRGVGAEALISLAPTFLDFGGVAIGQAAEPRQVILTNRSKRNFAGTFSSDNPVFSVARAAAGAVTQTAFSLAANTSAAFDVVFQPDRGGPLSAQVTFQLESTGTEAPLAVTRFLSLQGEGIAPAFTYLVVAESGATPVAPGDAVLLPPSTVGSTSSVEFELRNEGSSPSTVGSVRSSGAGFFVRDVPPPPFSVEPGEAVTFRIVFEPASLGTALGGLAVDDATFPLRATAVLPGATITGVGSTVSPGEQPQVGVDLSAPAPEPLTGALIMTFTPDQGLADDPALQFASGGRRVSFTLPAGGESAVFGGQPAIGFQSGTVAGTIRFTAVFDRNGVDITPIDPPEQSTTVPASPPTITAVLVESVTPSGFTVVVSGFSTTREITQATFRFTGRSGVQVQPSSVTPAGIAEAFADWFEARAEESQVFGSQFTLQVPFTISGEQNAIASVSVTLSNSQGASEAVSANVP